MLIRAELLALGINGTKMIDILQKEYGITVIKQHYSAYINGKKSGDKAIKIREACWDYINKHKRKKENDQ